MEDKTFTYVFYDILEKVLQLSENPSQFAAYLTQQIRELIGVKTIVITRTDETDTSKIYSVFPVRKTEWANQEAIIQLSEICLKSDTIQFFNDSENREVSEILSKLDIEKAIAVPLIAGNRKVGSILLLDIMDLAGIDAVIEILTRLSGVFALIIRNSLLYYNLEKLVEQRTAELQLQNQKLIEREQELNAANEEYHALNEELVENVARTEEINLQLVEAKVKTEESEKQLSIVYNNTTDLLCLLEVGADKSMRYVSVNKTYLEAGRLQDFILSESDFINKNVSAVLKEVLKLDDKTIEAEVNQLLDVVESKLIKRFVRAVENPFGTVYLETNLIPIVNHEQVCTHILWSSRNITELKKTEIELIKAKEKAEESDRLKTAFLQNMSHEIRTPMNAIMGFSSLLVNNFNNKEKLHNFSKIIEQRCNDLLDIINDILDISKIESGQNNVNIEECDLNRLFTELSLFFGDYQKRTNKQHIQLKMLQTSDENIARIKTDKLKLKQILINLISNAFKFTESGWVECGFSRENDKVLFYVSDTGIGIPKDKYSCVFERFVQLKQLSARNIGGTGLGLSIVKGLVELLGGNVWLESECNKGTTFFFTINYINLDT